MNNEENNKERRVHWDEHSINKPLMLQFGGSNKRKPSFSKIKNRILNFLRNQEYEKLSEWLITVLPGNNSLQEFFDAEGDAILKHALAYVQDLKIFEFIKECFSIDNIRGALKKEQYGVLKEFFFSQVGAEISRRDDPEYRTYRIEKFKFLFNIGADIVEEFMKKNNDATYITHKIQEDLTLAEQQIKKNIQPTKRYEI